MHQKYQEIKKRNAARNLLSRVHLHLSFLRLQLIPLIAQKFTTRRQIASVMLETALSANDRDGVELWSFVLRCVTQLTEDGMSEEEDTVEGDEPVKAVLGIDFRHLAVRDLMQMVDDTRTGDSLGPFVRAGRRRIRRVNHPSVVKRKPKAGISPSFYRPEYLAQMRQGVVPAVAVGEQDWPISR
ncbi:hypothetical protein BT96DRAFT_835148 [Gymnopus androsaceus JB14]|uniref:Uncharacterized protein n=1 Tax=Gymnopus androsaceus JB14 TaxID=1447944 RepID=A0A6A4GTX2_9AGAR|nr:hypothetical protein BT96DRAFT_835148 [Gymnopus androsaceus JB14]